MSTIKKKKLLIVRDVISREIYQLENKVMESRLSKIKYKFLEDRKDILIEFLITIDEELLSTDVIKGDDVNLDFSIAEMPII